MVEHHPAILQDMYKVLFERTSDKMVLMNEMTSENDDVILLKLMHQMKVSQDNLDKFSFEIPHTRKQLDALTGLSVQTTIRVMKRMEKSEIL